MSGRLGGQRTVRDDDLRAMLEARADRLTPDAEHNVLAAVRKAVHEPRGSQGLTVLPVSVTGRGSRRPVGWAAAGLVAVLVIAVLGGPLGAGPAPTGASPSGSFVPASPSIAPTDVSALRALDVDSFRAELAAGALQGQVVVVQGRLEAQPAFCQAGGTAPCLVRIHGLPGIQVLSASPSDSTWGLTVERSVGQAIAVRVLQSAMLRFLGYLRNDPAQPLSVDRFASVIPKPDEVTVVEGWLINGDGDHRLAGTDPRSEGVAGLTVDVSADSGVRASGVIGPGRFLARRNGGIEIVGWLDESTVAVTISDQTIMSSFGPWQLPTTPALTIDDLPARIGDRSLDGRLVLLPGTLERVALPCPSGTTDACSWLEIVGLDGVPVTWDGAEFAGPPEGGQDSTLAVVPDGGSLRLLGRLADDPDHAPSYQDLISRFGAFRADPYWVDVVAGWLVVGGIHSCPALGVGATPCPGPVLMLTDQQPTPDGMMTSDLQVPVVVAASASGINAGQVVTPGPFLIREHTGSTCDDLSPESFPSCAGGRDIGQEIVARYDPSTVVRVQP